MFFEFFWITLYVLQSRFNPIEYFAEKIDQLFDGIIFKYVLILQKMILCEMNKSDYPFVKNAVNYLIWFLNINKLL
jgi:hypothetical protein